MNDLTLQNTIDENLRPVKSGDKVSALEISTEKVRVKDLEVLGSTEGVSATDGTKLPLTGGTMSGNVDFGDNDITNVDSLDADKLSIAGGAEMTAINDEDDMTSDSATALATQQSIKAYVVSQVGSLASTVAGKLPKAGGTMTGDISHAGNFSIDVEGDLTLDANGGNISLLDDGSTYTPTAASDAVPLNHMPFVLYSQFQDDVGTSGHYLPLRGYFEQSTVGNEPSGMIAPFNMKLQKAIMRCNTNISGATWTLGMWAISSGSSESHHHTSGKNFITATGGAIHTNATFDFTGTVGLASSSTGGSNAVTAGQWVDFALQSDTDVTSSSSEFWITLFFIADLSNTI